MKAAIIFACVCLLTAVASEALDSEDRDNLRDDFKEARSVAQVQVESIREVRRIGGYTQWLLTVRILESFKGDLRLNHVYELNQSVENAGSADYLYGNKIVFLKRLFSEKERKSLLCPIENSTRDCMLPILKELRRIKRN